MKKATESRENLVNSTVSLEDGNAEPGIGDHPSMRRSLKSAASEFDLDIQDIVLTKTEKRFLLSAERGDCATVRRIIQENKETPEEFDINCVDPLNRSALIAAIENENIELINLLLREGIKVKDALLHAIKEEYVEAVETLLLWEEENHVPGDPYSWEAVDRSSSSFTADITPLILAAHKNNYEILKILLDRGATLPMPHDVRCGCDECVTSSEQDSLRHSQSRINAYKALSSSSLIALSSKDPISTAFHLSWELRRLSRMETEFRAEYTQMRAAVQEFATALLDHARTSNELEIMLNFSPGAVDNWEPGERQTLERLKLALNHKQKMFVAHPNVQQLLAAIWYEGLPGFRRKSFIGQIMQVAKLGTMFPVYSLIYMIAPNSEMGLFMKKPFVKFIVHSASYAFFLMLLGGASQRVEYLAIEWFGPDWAQDILAEWKRKERGSLPGMFECLVILYIISLIWHEMKSLWNDGLMEYVSDLWNIVDFISNTFYIVWMSLRFTSWYTVWRDARAGLNPWYPREQWDPFDPMLLSEGAFAAGMIFSFLKLVHIFSINPHLGPLQVSLGRMIIDIIKFFFIYTLVLFAFGCGLNQLLWYYAVLEKNKCFHLPSGLPDFDNNEKACAIWRRFANLFETSQSLFWASFGLVDLMAFELSGIKSFTRFWALLMFGSYSVINIIVLLNMLIAMMSNSYQIISERSDTEWKFARSRLWMSYFEDGDTLPPPFNLFPSIKNFTNLCKCSGDKRSTTSIIKRNREKAQRRHENVMKLLVRRYVTAEQRKRDDFGITEDDVMEIRQDISTLRYELIDILHQNGMRTPNLKPNENAIAGKKGRVMERRILKDFQIGFVEGILQDTFNAATEKPADVFSTIAKAIGNKSSTKKKKPEDWNALVRRSTVARDPIGNSTEAIMRRSRQSLRKQILDNSEKGLEMDTDHLVAYNPKLSEVTPVTRVAYVKFMTTKLKKDMTDVAAAGGVETAEFEHERRKSWKQSSIKKLVDMKDKISGAEGDGAEGSEPKEVVSAEASVTVEEPSPTNSATSGTVERGAPATEELSKLERIRVRVRSPIIEDPNEERSDTPASGSSPPVPPLDDAIPERPVSPIPPNSPPLERHEVPDLAHESREPTPESESRESGSKSPEVAARPMDTLSPTGSTKSGANLTAPRSRSPSSAKTPERLSPTAEDTSTSAPAASPSARGKSKSTGRTLGGWL
ncbi:transient receptor potential protein isoform X2 [Anopheles ziemanni]|uniref:transient receptor potential protein isoform X2 n=1 Tax=Anopheles coustani TaxID=139045 RepID=UPI00265B23BF|nr:transient receptor potential protein isoform X2 [Anopheles coustani]XP_058176443.1 transient receptor potential protein isoform X2 [Anopheles ziemanni]